MTTTMRAAVMRDRKLVVADVPVPEAGPGEVLVRTLACGICGSDLHALKFADQFVATARRAGNPRVMDLGRDVIMATSSAPRSSSTGRIRCARSRRARASARARC